MEAAFIADAKSWSDIAANLVQVAAILVGGWWAYTKFIRQREEWPRITLEQLISDRVLNDEKALLRVSVAAKNTGTVLVNVQDVRVDVHQVLPLTPETEEELNKGSLVPEQENEANWPCLGSLQRSWSTEEACIEPGENDQYGFDFVVPREIDTVFVYCYIRNVKHREREMGWQLSQFFDLERGAAPQTERVEDLAGKSAS